MIPRGTTNPLLWCEVELPLQLTSTLDILNAYVMHWPKGFSYSQINLLKLLGEIFLYVISYFDATDDIITLR